jgi:hypothetical protein
MPLQDEQFLVGLSVPYFSRAVMTCSTQGLAVQGKRMKNRLCLDVPLGRSLQTGKVALGCPTTSDESFAAETKAILMFESRRWS